MDRLRRRLQRRDNLLSAADLQDGSGSDRVTTGHEQSKTGGYSGGLFVYTCTAARTLMALASPANPRWNWNRSRRPTAWG